MGKGDKKTKRGKIVNKSYGVRRPRKVKKDVYVPKAKEEVKEEAEKVKKAKPAAKKTTAKKSTAKSATAKKPAAKKTTAKKSTTKKEEKVDKK